MKNDFDLKKFLVENKLTSVSKKDVIISESESEYTGYPDGEEEEDYVAHYLTLKGGKVTDIETPDETWGMGFDEAAQNLNPEEVSDFSKLPQAVIRKGQSKMYVLPETGKGSKKILLLSRYHDGTEVGSLCKHGDDFTKQDIANLERKIKVLLA